MELAISNKERIDGAVEVAAMTTLLGAAVCVVFDMSKYIFCLSYFLHNYYTFIIKHRIHLIA